MVKDLGLYTSIANVGPLLLFDRVCDSHHRPHNKTLYIVLTLLGCIRVNNIAMLTLRVRRREKNLLDGPVHQTKLCGRLPLSPVRKFVNLYRHFEFERSLADVRLHFSYPGHLRTGDHLLRGIQWLPELLNGFEGGPRALVAVLARFKGRLNHVVIIGVKPFVCIVFRLDNRPQSERYSSQDLRALIDSFLESLLNPILRVEDRASLHELLDLQVALLLRRGLWTLVV